MSMTPEQRETAIERMAAAMCARCYPEPALRHRYVEGFKADAEAALGALLAGFVVLSRDDVTDVTEALQRIHVCATNGSHPAGKVAFIKQITREALARWEPITKEEDTDGD